MKIVNIPVEVITHTDINGKINPIKIKYIENNESKIIKINKVIKTDINKYGGNTNYIYLCNSVMDNKNFYFELSYNISLTKWYIFKI